MKKRNILALMLILALALTSFAGCGGSGETEGNGGEGNSQELPTYHFDVGSMFINPETAPDFNPEGTALAAFAKILEEKSEGRITATIHWASILGGMDELFDMMRTGDLAMAYSCGAGSADARFGVFNMPGVVTSLDMAHDVFGSLDSDLLKVYQGICNENNVQCISGSVGTLRGVFNKKKEIHTPDDMKGLMLRAYNDNTVTTFWNGLCNTTILPMGELYTALQLGTVDGFEHGPLSGISNGLCDVVDYYSDVNWQWQVMPLFMMSKDVYDKLDPETVAIIEDAAAEAVAIYREEMTVNLEDAYDYMESVGVEVYKLTDEERAAWGEYGDSLKDKFVEYYGKDLVEEVLAISNDYKAAH